MIGWGIDVGVGSVGFAVIRRNAKGQPEELIDGVAHIFPSSAGSAERRTFRAIRNGYRRRNNRVGELKSALSEILGCDNLSAEGVADVLYDGKQTTARVHLRAIGLNTELSQNDLFKAVVHIAQNRGQRLTRGLKDDDKDEEKQRSDTASKAVGTRAHLEALAKRLGQADPATPGQMLFDRLRSNKPTRLRKDVSDTPVFTRGQVEDELTRLLKAQSKFHLALEDEMARQRIFELAFWEEDPKPPVVGRCMYGTRAADDNIEERLKAATELFQCKRIYEEVNNLRLRDRRTAETTPLTLAQRNAVADLLLSGQDLTAARLRKTLKLGNDALSPLTSLEEQKGTKGRKTEGKLAAHPLAQAMAKIEMAEDWQSLDEAAREALFEQLAGEDDSEKLLAWLEATHGITGEKAAELSKLRLPAHRASAGKIATAKLLAELRRDVISLFEAEQRAGLKRATAEAGERLDRLPYYGELFSAACIGGSQHPAHTPEARYGKLPNPVVHTALNRLRHLANEFVKRYGPPQWINLELARDLNKSAEERETIERTIRDNQTRNDKYAKTILAQGARVNRRNLMKMRLYEWQAQTCLYSGKTIAMNQLFTGEVEIDHILPRAETMDDSAGNLALVFKTANQHKGKRTPYEAFKGGYDGRDYPTILQGVENKRRQSLWRFEPNAMDRYRKSGAMPSRFLGDTRYIAKLAAAYLAHLMDDRSQITSVTGGMTAQLRHLWGLDDLVPELMAEAGRLDRKYLMATELKTDEDREERAKFRRKLRYDHRHHLLDALVVGCCTRSDVQRLETLAARVEGYGDLRDFLQTIKDEGISIFRETGLPWRDGFRSIVKDFLAISWENQPGRKSTRVTHKRDHNPLGELHAKTFYGVICELPDSGGQYLCGTHQKLADLKTVEQVGKIGVANAAIAALQQALDAGAYCSWGSGDPVAALLNLQREQNTLRQFLLDEIAKAPADRKEEEKVAWAAGRVAEITGQRRYRRIETKTLRIIKGAVPGGRQPLAAVATANNDRLVHWLDKDGNGHWDVIASIDSAQPGFKEPWADGNGRLIFRLRKNDVVEMAVDPKDTSAGRALYRLAKLSPGDLEFVPVAEARTAKDGRGIFTKRLRSPAAMEAAQIRAAVFTPGGRQEWQSRSRNRTD